jgi:hypothetical protein
MLLRLILALRASPGPARAADPLKVRLGPIRVLKLPSGRLVTGR